MKAPARREDMAPFSEARGRVEKRPVADPQSLHRIFAREGALSGRSQLFDIGRQSGYALRCHIAKSAIPAGFVL